VLSPEEALERLTQAQPQASGNPPLDQWAAHYIESLTGITAGTRLDYTRIYGRTWQPLLGQIPIDVLNRTT
jgi:hypothetical protein